MSRTVKVPWYYQDKQEHCPECGKGLRCCPSCQDRKYCQQCIPDYCPACMVKVEYAERETQ